MNIYEYFNLLTSCYCKQKGWGATVKFSDSCGVHEKIANNCKVFTTSEVYFHDACGAQFLFQKIFSDSARFEV